MKLKPLIGLALIALGAGALAWPDFEYTREGQEARVGPLAFSLKTKDTVHIPAWAGLAAIGIGTLLVWRRKG